MSDLSEVVARPREFVARTGTPDAISEWKAVTEGFLTHECCVFHRNVEISSRYAWMYRLMPAFKWAGMAAIASHHVRLALFPSGWTLITPATWTSRAAWFVTGCC